MNIFMRRCLLDAECGINGHIFDVDETKNHHITFVKKNMTNVKVLYFLLLSVVFVQLVATSRHRNNCFVYFQWLQS